jgi:hypothetical protein
MGDKMYTYINQELGLYFVYFNTQISIGYITDGKIKYSELNNKTGFTGFNSF